jgi:hypothetical protein
MRFAEGDAPFLSQGAPMVRFWAQKTYKVYKTL